MLSVCGVIALVAKIVVAAVVVDFANVVSAAFSTADGSDAGGRKLLLFLLAACKSLILPGYILQLQPLPLLLVVVVIVVVVVAVLAVVVALALEVVVVVVYYYHYNNNNNYYYYYYYNNNYYYYYIFCRVFLT